MSPKEKDLVRNVGRRVGIELAYVRLERGPVPFVQQAEAGDDGVGDGCSRRRVLGEEARQCLALVTFSSSSSTMNRPRMCA